MKQYVAVHKNDWTERDIVEQLIEPEKIQYNHQEQTYWEPGVDEINFNVYLNPEFNKIVQVMELNFFGENEETLENPWAVIVDGFTYCFNEEENWESLLNSLGWVIFNNELGEDFEDTSEAVKNKIQKWVHDIAEEKAWNYIIGD